MTRVWPSEVDGLAVRKDRRIVVLSAEQYDPGFPPASLMEFEAWFKVQVDAIPAEHRESATIEFDSVGSYYDSHYGRVEISYSRPETDEEWEARKVDVMSRVRAEEDAQRRAYLNLKTKFEGSEQ